MKIFYRILPKKYSIIIFFLMLFIWFIFFIFIGFSIAEEQEINIQQQQQKLNEIEQRKKDIEKEIERLKQEKVDYQKSLQKIQDLLSTAEKELQVAKNTYENTLKEITKLEEELNIEQNKLDLQMIILKNRLKKFYKYNNISYLAILINSKDFSQFLNRYRYLKQILENDSDIIKQVKEQVDLVKKQRDSFYNKKEITRMLEQEIAKEKENIEMSMEAKNKYLVKIEEERKKQLAVLEELEKSSAQIKEIIDTAYLEMEKARTAQQQAQPQQRITTSRKEPTLQPKKGIFHLPVSGSIISNFGQQKQPDLNAYVFNSGIDISASLGEPVRAASFGSVIYIGNVKGYGDLIILDHGGNVVTLYAHLSKVLIKLNDQVSRGQIIGQIGTSGGVPSPRLHFEVRVEGKPANPFDWL
ncbi:MAG: peptidoglycan DD-metalloendopeptidase family protein [Atribacterota bacterium]|nr:peptidoglycan DD-metalloendopeptidase family protein [Atribacterota bacterium]MDD4896578.1 peptidoglycan DD-metalloendopeptidase family protein [Atribacterota bacterium]MDD5637687.1 peptidoglycan DD-metalloendopeptidase family protein [Atribacterota bacterium]